MNILFISNDPLHNKTDTLSRFQTLTCNDNFHFYADLRLAKIFLEENIIKKKKHLDFIAISWAFGDQNSKSLIDFVRNSDAIYSDDNFLLRSIPILLIEDEDTQSNEIINQFDGVLINLYTENQYYSALKGVIKRWRTKLSDDLELIGLNPKTQDINFTHRQSFISYFRLQVLSKEFVQNKSKKLNYIWTTPNYGILTQGIEVFENQLKKSKRTRNGIYEKSWHDTFNTYPFIIRGDSFEHSHY